MWLFVTYWGKGRTTIAALVWGLTELVAGRVNLVIQELQEENFKCSADKSQLIQTYKHSIHTKHSRHIPAEGKIASSKFAYMLFVFLSKLFGAFFINYFILFIILDSNFSSDIFSAIFCGISSLSLGTCHAHKVGLINEAWTMLCCVSEWSILCLLC